MASGGSLVNSQSFDVPEGAPDYLHAAIYDIGISEEINDGRRTRSNPLVESYSEKAIGKRMDARSVPWCAYWMNAKLIDAGLPGTNSGMARSFLRWGNEVSDGDWKVGDIVVFWRGRRDDGVTGHVAVLLKWNSRHVYCLGGNQGDKVCIQRFTRSKIIGVRRHRSWWQSKTLISAAGSAGSGTASKVSEISIPEPTSALDAAAKTVKDIHGPLETIASTVSAYKAEIVLVFALVSIGLGLYAAYQRYKDHRTGKNT